MAGGFLNDLRETSVLVIHPPDRDGAFLVDHLRRIGCPVEPRWPVPGEILETYDVVIVAIARSSHDALQKLLRKMRNPRPAVIAVVNYENPATLQLVLETEALAVIGTPIRPFGLLTNLVLSRSILAEQRAMEGKLAKLELRLVAQKRIASAKSILMQIRQIDEQTAYKFIRAQAMSKRISMEQVAASIINAHALLNSKMGDD